MLYMNRYAYQITGLAIKAISRFLKAKINIFGAENIPAGAIIFTVNHFTRFETLFLPYHIYQITRIPIWSLADYSLFKGALATFLDAMGAVSTKDPDRDNLIVSSLLAGDAAWIIFPEGCMVKSKKIKAEGGFMVSCQGIMRPPHTGAATLALRTEFYRQRLQQMTRKAPDEAKRLVNLFNIQTLTPVLEKQTFIVPVNLTYYPMRARENILSHLAAQMVDDIPARALEEMMTEGTMLFSGVDVDIRFGEPIEIGRYMKSTAVKKDMASVVPIDFDDPIYCRPMLLKSARKIMDRYMSSIYGMTAVNHDHLFATILKRIPDRTIDENDLRRRVYLATTLHVEKAIKYRHKSLKSNQIHLLTDDRYGKYENFISVAIKKGIIEKYGSLLIKTRKFDSSPDFHQARIENPVAVIANEVDALAPMQEAIAELAGQPELRIKYRVTKHLMDKATFDFEKDYATYYLENESKGQEIGKPYLVKGTKKQKMGVLLIHGYMAAPMEVADLANYLGSRGLRVYVPRLKGHGTSPEDLAARTHHDWIDSVDEGFVIIKNMCEQVVVGGFSAGAGLALNLAARMGDVDGVFAVCPPLKLQDISSKLVPALDAWNRLMERAGIEAVKKEFVDNHPEHPHINYGRNPIAGVYELERLMDVVRSQLPDIKAPAVVIQSYKDPVVSHQGAYKVFERLGSAKKEYVLINYERHGILSGDDAGRVHTTIYEFVDYCRSLAGDNLD
jgi:esterase/lipase/1-acyl-sn-glycerol-3-phosphate acyltransferase